MLRIGFSLVALAAAGAADLVFPPEAPRLPARIDAAAAERASSCAWWSDPNHRPVPAAEAVTLRGAAGVVRRGKRLTVRGRAFVDVAGEQEMDTVSHRYAGRLRGVGADVVYERPYEGHRWLLLGSRGEAPVALPGLPVAAPHGQVLAAATDDGVFGQRSLVIVERRKGGLTVAAEFPEAAYPCDLHWTTDEELRLKVSTDPGQGPGYWAPATVRPENGGWVLHAPPSAARR